MLFGLLKNVAAPVSDLPKLVIPIEDLNLLGSSFEILSIENEGVIEEGFKKKKRELEEIFLKLNPQAEEFAPPPLSNDHGVVPISPSGEQFRFDAFNFVMQNGLADGNFNRNVSIFSCFSFSSYWKTVYLQMIGSQFHFDAFKFITQNGLVDGNFNRKVVDCRICGDPNFVLRFAFIEFFDEGYSSKCQAFFKYFCGDVCSFSLDLSKVPILLKVRAVIKGRVQEVIYSDWDVKNAKELSLKG
ncbi:hypothetical protein BC332_05553 [Capsicum chinense]|nr:hypothetical protein BC332_05553 [Capsicum chinense]